MKKQEGSAMTEGQALRGMGLVWKAIASVRKTIEAIQASELGTTSGSLQAEDELSQLEDATAAVSALLKAHRVRSRSKFRADATLIVQRTRWHANVSNVSVDGCGLSLLEPIEAAVTIPFDGVHISRPGVIRWSRGLRVGVEFSADKGVAQQGELETF